MLGLPIVDTHLHLWDPHHLSYPWLRDIPLLNKPYLLKDYQKHCGAVHVKQMVFLQCDCHPVQNLQEATWVAALAREEPRITGIVPSAQLEQGKDARAELEALTSLPLVKGVRRLIQSEPAGFCVQPDFVRGVQMLAEFGLHFEICIFHPQFEDALEMVRQCSEVSFILDHIGKPDIKNHVLEPWQRHIRELAALPNVFCKVSGLVTEADHDNWTKEDLKPYIDHVIASFGFDRCVYGGDWPVAYQAAPYPQWVETLQWAVEGCSETEIKKLFHDNAVAFYRLSEEEMSEQSSAVKR